MQKVITINLNGNAYQIDEDGYAALVAYLEGARRSLKDNPDLAEIIADLEQAIADKCRNFLGPHKTVVTAAEVDQIIREMGPVDGSGGAGPQSATGDEARSAGASAAAAGTGAGRGAPRRLYLIHEGAMLAGVCNGLAAYLHLDVTLVRIAFLLLALITRGGFGLANLALAFVIPPADTSEEKAAAHGQPFNAQELIDRAKQQYASFADSHGWRRRWRREQRAWRRKSVALFWALLFAIFSLVTQQEVLGQPLPDEVPLWLGIVILVVVYQAIAWPLHTIRRSSYYTIGGVHHGALAAMDGVLSLSLSIFAFWVAIHYLPELR